MSVSEPEDSPEEEDDELSELLPVVRDCLIFEYWCFVDECSYHWLIHRPNQK